MRVATVRSKEILKLFSNGPWFLPPRDQARLQRRAHEILDHAVPEVALQLAEPGTGPHSADGNPGGLNELAIKARRLDAGRMPWTAPQSARQNPPYIAGERQMLEAWLDFHRQTLLGKCSGLTADQLRQRAAPPSSLSLLGLVRHMAEVERGWFRRRVAGEDAGFLLLQRG